jgi:trans-aconitate 2-methyltransferase
MEWSAQQYRIFEAERSRPAADLVSRIETDGVVSAVDLGCGPGNSTEILHVRFPQASVVGIDRSEDMLEAARRRLPEVTFERADIAGWRPAAPVDVILANASLQWVPDHETLFPALLEALATGGTLAVQMPDNLDEPSHRLMREIAADGPWAGRIADAEAMRAARHEARWYYALLKKAGAAGVDVWRTTYNHPLAGVEGVVDWLKGTGLRPFLEPLSSDETEAYLARYRAGLAEAYPLIDGGVLLLPFPRLFIVATR